jgi:hypothetical protein
MSILTRYFRQTCISIQLVCYQSYPNSLLALICYKVQTLLAALLQKPPLLVQAVRVSYVESMPKCSPFYLLHILLTLAALRAASVVRRQVVRRHQLEERQRDLLEESRLSGSRHASMQPDPGLSLPRFEQQSPCVGCARFAVEQHLLAPCFSFKEPPLLPLAILLESHFSTTMLKLASSLPSAIAMSQKLFRFAKSESTLPSAAADGLPQVWQYNGVPPSDVRRGDLECHGSGGSNGLFLSSLRSSLFLSLLRLGCVVTEVVE